MHTSFTACRVEAGGKEWPLVLAKTRDCEVDAY